MSSLKRTQAATDSKPRAPYNHADVEELIRYVLDNHFIGGSRDEIPLDRSLVEAGILDSYEIIELVDFIERHWGIEIEDQEITKENMGSIVRMAMFIAKKQLQ